MNKICGQEEDPETLALFLNLAMEDIDSNPSSLQPYTEEMAAADDELLAGVTEDQDVESISDYLKSLPSAEPWLQNNAQARASVERGLEQASQGQRHYLGSFAQFADLDIDEDAALPSPVESFRKSWKEAMTEQVKPISQLWDNPYDPLFDEDEPSERLPLNADPSDTPKSVEVDWGNPQGAEIW